MSDDLTVLRKHEAALSEAMSSNRIYMRKLDDAGERAYWQGQQDALDYALSRLREEIAREEAIAERFRYAQEVACREPFCVRGVVYPRAKDGGGKGTTCRACNGTGKRPTEVT